MIGGIESRSGCGLVQTVGEFSTMSVCSSIEKRRLCRHRSIRFIFPELGNLDGSEKRRRPIRETEGRGARTHPFSFGLVRIRGKVLGGLTDWHVTSWLVGRFSFRLFMQKKKKKGRVLPCSLESITRVVLFCASFPPSD